MDKGQTMWQVQMLNEQCEVCLWELQEWSKPSHGARSRDTRACEVTAERSPFLAWMLVGGTGQIWTGEVHCWKTKPVTARALFTLAPLLTDLPACSHTFLSI